ncbi:F0F1 ATP synthase subunit B family protein [Streptomyces sp. NPDC001153]
MGPLEPKILDLIVALICFVPVWAIMAKVLLPRLEKTLAARDDAIEGRLEQSEEARAEAARIYAEYQAELSAARHEAAQTRQAATEEGAALIAALRAEGQQVREKLIAEAKVQLDADRILAEAELREDVFGLATELAGRMVGEPLADLPRAREVADGFFAEVDAKTASKA